MTEALKPCPFCGTEPYAQSTITDAAIWCTGCGAKVVRLHYVGTTVDRDAMPRVVAAWNRRAPTDEAAALADMQPHERDNFHRMMGQRAVVKKIAEDQIGEGE